MRIVSEIKRKEFNFAGAPVLDSPGYVAAVGGEEIGRFPSALDAAWAAARADFERGRPGFGVGDRQLRGPTVHFEGSDRPAGAMRFVVRVCYRTREERP